MQLQLQHTAAFTTHAPATVKSETKRANINSGRSSNNNKCNSNNNNNNNNNGGIALALTQFFGCISAVLSLHLKRANPTRLPLPLSSSWCTNCYSNYEVKSVFSLLNGSCCYCCIALALVVAAVVTIIVVVSVAVFTLVAAAAVATL